MNLSPITSSADGSMTAAHHCLAAENFFARAKELQRETADENRKPTRFSRRVERLLERHYERYMQWAGFHLRFAEVITEGSGLVVAHSQAAANPGTNLHRTYVYGEAAAWDDFIAGRPLDSRARWLTKPDAMDAEF